MQEVLNSTDVRRNWSRFIDEVLHDKPKIVKRNRDCILSLSVKQAKVLFSGFSLKARYLKEKNGTITATLDGFDLAVNRADEPSARKALAEELMDYAREYFAEFQLYFNSPNRRSHFPYVLSVLIQEDLNGVMDLISA
jgi:archaeosine-15-forming tRNA-guanine transglycosylase